MSLDWTEDDDDDENTTYKAVSEMRGKSGDIGQWVVCPSLRANEIHWTLDDTSFDLTLYRDTGVTFYTADHAKDYCERREAELTRKV